MTYLDRFTWTRRAGALTVLATTVLWAAGCGQGIADKEKMETLSVGTEIVASLQNTIDTGKNKVGDRVTLRSQQEVRVNEVVVVPTGSTINGEVTHIDPAGRVAGGAELTLRFVELVTPDGKSYPISAVPIRMKGKGDAKESALQVGGGAVVGGIIGGILGGSDDIGKGAAAGAAAGTGVAVATKGDQIVLPAGQKIRVSLDAPVAITVKPGVAS